MKKAETNAVEETQLSCDSGEEPCAAFRTEDSLDETSLHVVRHTDGDISIYVNWDDENSLQQVVMSPEQAKEFFTLALTLC